VDFRIEESKLTDTLNREWSKALSFQPINAYRIVEPNDSIRIIPEINAYQIDMNEVKKRLKLNFPAASNPWLKKLKENIPLHLKIELPLTEVKPAVTSLSLKNQGISRKISQFTTNILTSAAGRIHNISYSAQTMQDQLLAPGEIFDYSQIIRQTEKTYGYQEAPVIYNGKLVPGIGGGICQVSSTLYNAVLRAGLQIIERRNHSLPVSYVPLGQDATYATGYINFRFRNSSDHYILIRSYVEGDALTIKLFGSIPQEKTFEITSHVVKMLLPSTRFLLNSALAANERQTLEIGKIGYIVETYRFQRQAGVLTNKELVSRDTYAAQPSLVAVGKGVQVKLEPNKAPLLEDGVSGPNF
jgi:vancomycin resistance protein YoaR